MRLNEEVDEAKAKRLRGHRARMLKFAELVESGTAEAVSPQSLEKALQDATTKGEALGS